MNGQILEPYCNIIARHNTNWTKKVIYSKGRYSDPNCTLIVLQLDSDQESTDGEDEAVERGESLGRFSPNNLLFRAASVHNLPVMSQALALGARLDAELPDLSGCLSTPLHQSIMSG